MKRRYLGAVMAVGLAMAACSDDDGSASDGDVTTTSEAVADGPPSSTEAPAAGGAVLDDSFGTGGVLAAGLSASEHDRFISVVEGGDGLVYASGFTASGDDHMFAVSRFRADGTPDDSFGENGTVSINVSEGGGDAEVARGLVVQGDGKVVLAGPADVVPAAGEAEDLDVAIVRLQPDGRLDPDFGEAGIARIDLGAGKAVDEETYLSDNAWGLTERDGGFAVFAVTPNQAPARADVDFAVVGLTDTGQLDQDFGDSGVVIVDLDGSSDSARNIGTQDDGTILATGYSRDADGVVSPVLIRLSSDGVLDEGFGAGGVANHVVLPGVTESYQFVPQGDGYLMAGYGRGADEEEAVDLVVYRFTGDGDWDHTFGQDGVTRLDLAGEDDRGRNVTILPDGNILAVGSGKLDAENLDAMLVVLDPDGTPVETFGEGGHLLVDLGGVGDAFFGVTVTSEGSAALLAGFAGADPDGPGNDDAVLARLAL